jgi:hypothetical protein
MLFMQQTHDEALIIVPPMSTPKLLPVERHTLIDLGNVTPEGGSLDLYQTTGSSPPGAACDRDRNLAQHSEGNRVSKVRVHRREVA